MDLSVIIVNYNVKYFLEQCLHSVKRASGDLQTEVWVVDNNSVDGSCTMVQEKFPDVNLIRNDQNLGFSVANNQAIRKSSGRYILLLNPDTVIEEDTLIKCMGYMDEHPDTGGLGVKMIDGKGDFLPESKRSLPTPMVAFYKIFGLSKLFPRSRVFGRYHLGYLDKDRIHEVEILSGAFMMLRRSALEKVGLLDEDFFMYGEDIDMSYRLLNAGYKNIYFPETTIIHYKGESTKKGSLNYVLTFYRAMVKFARKHFSKKMAKSYASIINMAVYFRALLSLTRRFVRNLSLPALQAVLIFIGFYLIKPVWEAYRFQGNAQYPGEYMTIVVPIYILIWLLSLFFSGAYDTPVKPSRIFKGIFTGTLIILVIYALLPESLRFSRALLLTGATWALLSSYLISLIFHFSRIAGFRFEMKSSKRIAIIGKRDESKRVASMFRKTGAKGQVLGFVDLEDRGGVNPHGGPDEPSLGHIDQLPEIIKINHIDEIIFCARDVTSQEIIRQMMLLTNGRIEYKIAPPESLSIIGSHSINAPGDIYLIDFESINKPANRRNKRFLDVASSLVLLAGTPIMVFMVRHPAQAFVNIFRVLGGRYSWVGFHPDPEHLNLPSLKPGILYPADALGSGEASEETLANLNMMYVKNYSVLTDVMILLRNMRHIGRKDPVL